MRTNTKTAAIWFQSTHSLRSATSLRNRYSGFWQVSIHALLAECDLLLQKSKNILKSFNPRTPCGVRPDRITPGSTPDTFQSTHSLRSATSVIPRQELRLLVSIHALLAECDLLTVAEGCSGRVSIHALLAECDSSMVMLWFLLLVSIHALLAECDNHLLISQAAGSGFNPRTPCGVRPGYSVYVIKKFRVSIHALLAECDRGRRVPKDPVASFNPRTPCGVRLVFGHLDAVGEEFQSTHSLRSAT